MTTWPHNANTRFAAHTGASHPQNARAATGGDAARKERMRTIEMKLIDELESQIDDLLRQRKAASAPHSPLPLSQVRRRLAHLVRLPVICARATCQRAGLCHGEPAQCLSMISPLLPPDVVAKLRLGPRKTRRGRPQAFITPR
jgi:hypothetical protein